MVKQILNDEMFTVLVLMALFTTFMTTPTVMAIYKPSQSQAVSSQRRRRLPPLSDMQDELRILACIHGPGNIHSVINFIESIRATKKSQIKLYVMHLVELTDRSSSILMVQRNRKNGFPLINRFRRGPMQDQIASAIQAYGQVGQVTLQHLTGISALSTMHEDVCHVAETKRVAMIILPFHKCWRGEDEEGIDNIGQGWRQVNQRVLQNAPCSIAVLVHHGFDRRSDQPPETDTVVAAKRVCMIFIGGPNDRKALELGSRMAEHPTIRLTLVRFMGDDRSHNLTVSTSSNLETEKDLDDAAIAEFKAKWNGTVEFIERHRSDMREEVLAIGKAKKYELVIVGKGEGRLGSSMRGKLKDSELEHAELGPIGDLLSSTDHGIASSVIVIQDQHLTNSIETAPKILDMDKRIVITDATTGLESSV